MLAGLIAACQNRNNNQEPKVVLTPANFNTEAPKFVDQLVQINGMAVHVCRETGKRLFLGEERVKVVAGNKTATFDIGLEGSNVSVTGYIREQKIDEAYLDNLGKESKEVMHKGEGEQSHEGDSEAENKQKQINTLRQKIAASDQGYISIYTVEAVSVKEEK